MIKEIQSIIEWNAKAGNYEFKKHLENSLLAEEFSEVILALKEGNTVEATDGILDLFWVGIGTLYKMGLDSETIYACFKEIEASNYSKMVNGEFIKDELGKIQKPEGYFKPNLELIIK